MPFLWLLNFYPRCSLLARNLLHRGCSRPFSRHKLTKHTTRAARDCYHRTSCGISALTRQHAPAIATTVLDIRGGMLRIFPDATFYLATCRRLTSSARICRSTVVALPRCCRHRSSPLPSPDHSPTTRLLDMQVNAQPAAANYEHSRPGANQTPPLRSASLRMGIAVLKLRRSSPSYEHRGSHLHTQLLTSTCYAFTAGTICINSTLT